MATVLAPSRADRGFERLYRRYVADVYRYVLAVLQNEPDAEDATQTAFLYAYRAYERGERAERPLNWLIAIAHNVCRQRFRESARRPRLVELEEESVAARQTDEDTPRAEEIRRALGFLAFNQRAALVMRELQGRSYDEIAGILGLSTSAVETLLFRARRAMREQLEGGLSCGEAELALSRRADGELPFAERGPLRAHLRECAECASLERGLRSRSRAIRGIGLVPLPSSLGSFFGGGAAVGTGVGVGAKAAAVVLAGVLGSGLAGDAIQVGQSGVDDPSARAGTVPALEKQSPQQAPAVATGTMRAEKAAPARSRPARAPKRAAAAPSAAPAAAPAAAATGASPSAPADDTPTAPPANAPVPVQAPISPAAPATPAAPTSPATPGDLALPGLPTLTVPPPPVAPPAPSAPLSPDLPLAPTVPELPKVTVTVPGVQVPEPPRIELPPVQPPTTP